MDDRGQAVCIVRYILALMVGAAVTWVVWEISNPLLDDSKAATSNATANQGTEWLRTGVNNFPIFFLGISFFGLVALAVYERERLR